MSSDSLVNKVLTLHGFLALGLYSFFSIQFFEFCMDNLAYKILSLHGILNLGHYHLCSLHFFKFFMDTWNLNGYVTSLVSYQGDAATASWDITTAITFGGYHDRCNFCSLTGSNISSNLQQKELKCIKISKFTALYFWNNYNIKIINLACPNKYRNIRHKF